jgi:hypothetical protein
MINQNKIISTLKVRLFDISADWISVINRHIYRRLSFQTN